MHGRAIRRHQDKLWRNQLAEIGHIHTYVHTETGHGLSVAAAETSRTNRSSERTARTGIVDAFYCYATSNQTTNGDAKSVYCAEPCVQTTRRKWIDGNDADRLQFAVCDGEELTWRECVQNLFSQNVCGRMAVTQFRVDTNELMEK